jgi:undecaprenyl-diphosphatase
VDTTLFTLVNGSHAPALDDALLLASALGKAGFLWLTVAVIAAVFPRRRMAAWRLALAVGMAYLVVDGVIKPVIDRDRPYEVLAEARLIDQRPVTGSFPSGHTASSFAGALAASRLFPAARVVWWSMAVAVGVSRVYLGAHWPSDVVAGALVGVAVAWFTLGGSRVRWRGDRGGGRSPAPASAPSPA